MKARRPRVVLDVPRWAEPERSFDLVDRALAAQAEGGEQAALMLVRGRVLAMRLRRAASERSNGSCLALPVRTLGEEIDRLAGFLTHGRIRLRDVGLRAALAEALRAVDSRPVGRAEAQEATASRIESLARLVHTALSDDASPLDDTGPIREPHAAPVLARYLADRERARLADDSWITQAVTAALRAGSLASATGGRLLVLDGLHGLRPLERAFLRELALSYEEVVIHLPGLPNRVIDAEDTGDIIAAERALPALAADLRFFRQLGGGDARVLRRRPPPRSPVRAARIELADRLYRRVPGPGSLELFPPLIVHEAADPRSEVEAIALRIRRLLDEDSTARANPASIVVAFPSIARYAGLLRQLLPRYRVPFHLFEGVPLAQGGPVRAALDVFSLPVQGLRRGDVVRALSSPFVRFFDRRTTDAAPSRFPTQRMDRAARAAGVLAVDKNGEWEQRLRRHAAILAARLAGLGPEPARAEGASESPDRLSEQRARLAAAHDDAEAALDWLPRLRQAFEEVAGPQPIADLERVALQLLERFGLSPARLARNAAAFGHEDLTGDAEAMGEIVRRDVLAMRGFEHAIGELITTLGALGVERMGWTRFVSLLWAAIGSREIWFGEGGLPTGRIVVVGRREAHGLPCRHLIVGGLCEADFPASSSTMGSEGADPTGGASDPATVDRYLFASLLSAPSESLMLSYPRLLGDRESAPSPFLVELYRQQPNLIAGARELVAPRPPLAHLAAADLQRMLGQSWPESAAGPQLSRAAAVATIRRRPSPFGRYEGVLESAEARTAIAPRVAPERAFGVTALESYARCPFQYFALRLLGLRPLEEPEPDLRPNERGELVHRILARFVRELRVGGVVSFDPDRALQQMAVSAMTELETLGRDDLFSQRDARRLLGGLPSPGPGTDTSPGPLRRVVEHESARADGFTPTLVEASFGLDAGDGDVLAKDPIAVAPGVLLRGRIDRIDTRRRGAANGQDECLVIDYKTGRAPAVRAREAGVLLQPLAYVLAVEAVGPRRGGAWRAAGFAYYQIGATPGTTPTVNERLSAADGERLTSKSAEALDAEARQTFAERLGQSVARLRAGSFHPGLLDPGLMGCEHCDARTVCRLDAAKATRLATGSGS
jgi:RecB family exonuclease